MNTNSENIKYELKWVEINICYLTYLTLIPIKSLELIEGNVS